MSRLMRVLMAALAAMLVALVPGHASAQSGPPTPASTAECVDAEADPRASAGEVYLPSERWSAATSQLHTRLDADAWNDLGSKVARESVAPMLLSASSAVINTTSSFLEWSSSFSILCDVAPSFDVAAGVFGRGLLASPIVPGLLLIVFTSAVWRASRGQAQPWRQLGVSLLAVSLLALTSTAAAKSTDGDLHAWSPGWLTVRTHGLVQTVGGGLLGSLSTALDEVAADGVDADGETVAPSCAAYRQQLRREYAEARAAARTGSNHVALALSGMWESTQLASWRMAQFGPGALGRRVDCRYLEWVIGESGRVQRSLTTDASGLTEWPFLTREETSRNIDVDAGVVAWASCRWTGSTWVVSDEWAAVVDPTDPTKPAVTAADCENFFTADGAGSANDSEDGGFAYESQMDVARATVDPDAEAARVFLRNWQGHDSFGAIGFLLLSSIATMLSCGLWLWAGVSIFIAQLSLVLLIPGLVVFLVSIMIPGRATGERVRAFGRSWLMSMALPLIAIAMISVLAVGMDVLRVMLSGLLGEDSILSIALLSVAPLWITLRLMRLSKRQGYSLLRPMALGRAVSEQGRQTFRAATSAAPADQGWRLAAAGAGGAAIGAAAMRSRESGRMRRSVGRGVQRAIRQRTGGIGSGGGGRGGSIRSEIKTGAIKSAKFGSIGKIGDAVRTGDDSKLTGRWSQMAAKHGRVAHGKVAERVTPERVEQFGRSARARVSAVRQTVVGRRSGLASTAGSSGEGVGRSVAGKAVRSTAGRRVVGVASKRAVVAGGAVVGGAVIAAVAAKRIRDRRAQARIQQQTPGQRQQPPRRSGLGAVAATAVGGVAAGVAVRSVQRRRSQQPARRASVQRRRHPRQQPSQQPQSPES